MTLHMLPNKETTENPIGVSMPHACEDGIYNWAQPVIESVLLDLLFAFLQATFSPHVSRAVLFGNASKVMSERLRFAQSEDEVGGSIQSMCIYVKFGIQLCIIIISIIIIINIIINIIMIIIIIIIVYCHLLSSVLFPFLLIVYVFM